MHPDSCDEINATSLLFNKLKYISIKYVAIKNMKTCTEDCSIILSPSHTPLKTKQKQKGWSTINDTPAN